MININDLITNGHGEIQIIVTANDLMAFANHIIASLQNNIGEAQVEAEEEKEYLTREQMMEQYQVSKTTLHNWKIKGILVPVKVGRKVYYRKADVLAMLKGSSIKGA